MGATVDDLIHNALDLPEDQRFTLAHKILSSVEPPTASDIESAWDAEIQRRISQFKTGAIKTIPASEVFAEFKAQ